MVVGQQHVGARRSLRQLIVLAVLAFATVHAQNSTSSLPAINGQTQSSLKPVSSPLPPQSSGMPPPQSSGQLPPPTGVPPQSSGQLPPPTGVPPMSSPLPPRSSNMPPQMSSGQLPPPTGVPPMSSGMPPINGSPILSNPPPTKTPDVSNRPIGSAVPTQTQPIRSSAPAATGAPGTNSSTPNGAGSGFNGKCDNNTSTNRPVSVKYLPVSGDVSDTRISGIAVVVTFERPVKILNAYTLQQQSNNGQNTGSTGKFSMDYLNGTFFGNVTVNGTLGATNGSSTQPGIFNTPVPSMSFGSYFPTPSPTVKAPLSGSPLPSIDPSRLNATASSGYYPSNYYSDKAVATPTPGGSSSSGSVDCSYNPYYVNYGGSATGSSNYTDPVAQLKLVNITDVEMPNWMTLSNMVYGAGLSPFDIVCDGVSLSQFTGSQAPVPPIMFYPGSQTVMSNFLGAAFNVTAVLKNIVLKNNQIVLFAMESMNNTQTRESFQVSPVRDLLSRFQNGRCVVDFIPRQAAINEYKLKIFTDVAEAPICARVTPDKIQQLDIQCSYTQLQTLSKNIRTRLDAMAVTTDPAQFDQLMNEVYTMTFSEVWLACSSILDKVLVRGIKLVTMATRDCRYEQGDLRYPTDPCCNKQLGLTQCCRLQNVDFPVKTVVGFNSTALARVCSVDQKKLERLVASKDTFISAANQVDQCVANTAAAFGSSNSTSDLWQTYSSFVNECYNEIYNNMNGGYTQRGKACNTDDDCYTSCQADSSSSSGSGSSSSGGSTSTTGYCVIPYGNPAPYLQRCFVDKMNPSIKLSLMRSWGVYNPNNLTQFGAEFRQRTSVKRCSGPSGYKYNGGWYMPMPQYMNGCYQRPTNASYPTPIGVDSDGNPTYNASVYDQTSYSYSSTGGISSYPIYTYCPIYSDPDTMRRQGCFYLPPSQAGCESSKQCNWNSALSAAACATDRLFNNGSFCGQCFGQDCRDISSRPTCALSDTSLYSTDWQYNSLTGMSTPSPNPLYAAACNAFNATLRVDDRNVVCDTGASDVDSCNGRCRNTLKFVNRMSCVNRDLNTWYTCSNAFNGVSTKSGDYLGAYLNTLYDPSNWRLADSVCEAYVQDNATCTSKYGAYGFKYDYVWQSESSKLLEMSQQCTRNYCFNANITTPDKCWTLPPSPNATINTPRYGNWVPNLNNGKGGCIAQIRYDATWAQQRDTCRSIGPNWQFIPGTSWRDGIVDTKPKCDKGYCDRDVSANEQQCLQMSGYCDQPCKKCVAATDLSSGNAYSSNYMAPTVCYTNNATRCALDSNIASWNASSGMCLYSSNGQDTCKAYSDSLFLSCGNYDANSCTSNSFQKLLGCAVLPYAQCSGKAECQLNGQCNDDELEGYQYTYDPMSGTSSYQSTPRCILPTVVDARGNVNCYANSDYTSGGNWVYSGRAGCVLGGNVTPDKCQQLGGTMNRRATTREQCEATKRCCEPGRSCNDASGLTAKNATECAACGGKLVSVYSWQQAQWRTGQLVPGKWMQRAFRAQNVWSDDIDYSKMYQAVSIAISSFIGEVKSTELSCRLGPMALVLQTVAQTCDPTVVLTDDSTAQAVSYGSSNVLCGQQKTIYAGSANIQMNNDSVTDCSAQATISVGGLPATTATGSDNTTTSRFAKRSNLVHLGKRGVDTVSTDSSAACYAKITNGNNAYIGQQLGDCVILSSSLAIKNVEICMPMMSSIPRDTSTYPTYNVAIYSQSATGANIYRASTSSSMTPYVSNNQLCVVVNADKGSSTTYCPAAVTTSFATDTAPLTPPACGNSALVAAAVISADATLAAGATQLKISYTTVPSSITAGANLPSFSVAFQDANGNTMASAASTVTISIVSGTGKLGASLIGTVRVAAVNGVATFDSVSIDLAGTDYVLKASSGLLTPDTTSKFAVTAGDATSLKFTTQPGGAVVGIPFLQAPAVAVVDAYGNVVTGSSAVITVTAQRSDASLVSGVTGTTSSAAVSGVKTFSDLAVSSTANSIVLVASSPGLQSQTSVSFNVVSQVGYPVYLDLVAQPTAALRAQVFAVQPVVQVLDYARNLVSSASGTVTLMIEPGSGTYGASLSGIVSQPIVGGYAQFSGLSIDTSGINYRLVATSSGLVATKTAVFTVNGPASLKVSTQPPSSVTTEDTFSMTVQVLDVNGQVYKACNSDLISLSVQQGSVLYSSLLKGTTTIRCVNGVSTFSGLTIPRVGDGYVIVASTSLNGGMSTGSDAVGVTEKLTAGNNTGSGSGLLPAELNPIYIGAAVAGVIVLLTILAVVMLRCRQAASEKKRQAAKMAQKQTSGM